MQPASVKTHRPASRAKTGHATESTGNTHPDDSLTQQFDPLETAPIGPTLNPDTALQTDPPNNGHAAKSQGNGLTNLQGPINSLFNHGPH